MKKVYMVLNSTDVSDLLWCVMNAPERSEAERKRYLKLHARLRTALADFGAESVSEGSLKSE